MSTDPPGEDLYDRIDRLVDEDPIALRDLAWKLLAERDTDAIEHNAVRAEGKNAEARGYRQAIDALDFGPYRRWASADEPDLPRCGPRELDSVRRYLAQLASPTHIEGETL